MLYKLDVFVATLHLPVIFSSHIFKSGREKCNIVYNTKTISLKVVNTLYKEQHTLLPDFLQDSSSTEDKEESIQRPIFPIRFSMQDWY